MVWYHRRSAEPHHHSDFDTIRVMISFYPLPSIALGITGFLGFSREIVQRKLKNDDKNRPGW